MTPIVLRKSKKITLLSCLHN